MKTTTTRLAASAVIGAALVAACGGGDDDLSGGQTAFSIVPTEVTYSTPSNAPAGSCPAGAATQLVQVIGGAPPYTITNTDPTSVTVSTNRLDDEGGLFGFTFNGGCTETFVTVRDQYNRTVILTVKGVEGGS